MKSNLMFCLTFVLGFVHAFALPKQDTNLRCVFNSSQNIAVHSVCSRNDTTIVTISVKGDPGSVHDMSEDFRIVDSRGCVYYALKPNGRKVCIPLAGFSLYDIAFKTPHGIDWPFDLVAGRYKYRDFAIFGIDTSKKKQKTSKVAELHDGRCNSQRNVSYIRGKVSRPDVDYVSVFYRPLGTERDFDRRFPVASVDDDGVFFLPIESASPVWGTLKAGENLIPFFTIPNDTLDIRIGYPDSSTSHLMCEYNSSDMGVQRFLDADVLGAWVSDRLFLSPHLSASEMMAETAVMQDNLFDLCSYLVKKYSLDACQTHHLLNRVRLHVAVARLRYINSMVNAIQINSSRNKINMTDQDRETFTSAYDFLKDFDVEDLCLQAQQEYPMFLELINSSYILSGVKDNASAISRRLESFFSGKDVSRLISDLKLEREGTTYLAFEANRGRKIECSALNTILNDYPNTPISLTLCHSESELNILLSNKIDKSISKQLLLIPSSLKTRSELSELKTMYEIRDVDEDAFRIIREWLRIGAMPYSVEINRNGNLQGY